MKRKLLFKGTATALVTPFKKDGAVDEATLRDLVDFQIRGKVEALVVATATGEGTALSEGEYALVLETVVDAARGRVPVICGISSTSTTKAVALARQARTAGATTLLVTPPVYARPTQEGIYQHFSALADALELPMVIDNTPARVGCSADMEIVLQLAEEIPFITGITDGSGSLETLMKIVSARPSGFSVWSGHDHLALPSLALGADGAISVVANEVPRLFSDMVRMALKGNSDKARAIHYKLLPLMDANVLASDPIPVKAALAMMGLLREIYRLPLVSLSELQRQQVEKVLDELGLLSVA